MSKRSREEKAMMRERGVQFPIISFTLGTDGWGFGGVYLGPGDLSVAGDFLSTGGRDGSFEMTTFFFGFLEVKEGWG
jgi:hypothetical protein